MDHVRGTWYGGGPWSKRYCARWGPSSPAPKRGQSPQFPAHFLLSPNGWMHQAATWYGGRPQPRRLCVRWRHSPCTKRGGAPQFSAHVCCGQTAAWIKMPLGTEVGLGPGDIVLGGEPVTPTSPPPKQGHTPKFSAHVYCGQTARWIKMALGTEVGLGLVNIVLDGDSSPAQKGDRASPPIFGQSLFWPNG